MANTKTEEYKRRFPASGRLYEEARKYLPAGVNSTARAVWSGWEPYPLFAASGNGSRLTDADGNEFIDYLLGLGPMLLGHRPKIVTDAVVKHISDVGTVFALPCELDNTAAKKMCEIVPSVDQVRFLNSGTEAALYALRLARAYTDRQKIIRFEGMYHGFSDSVYWNKHPSEKAVDAEGRGIPEAQGPGVPEGIKDTLLICPWNDLDALTQLIEENHEDIAAVITEPIMCNTGCILPKPGYLEGMRVLTKKYGVVLIFDEVITGFRVALSGAQGLYHIDPDLSIFAKGMGGGYPVAALGGKKEIMQLVDIGKVSLAGTYSGNGIALSAVSATLDYLRSPGLYDALDAKSRKLREGVDHLWRRSKISAYTAGAGAMFQVWFADRPITNYREAAAYANSGLFRMWWEEMLFRGILFHPHYFENLFISTAHSEKDIDITLSKAEEAIASMEKRLNG
jgi:glutamate-1-semialdehyde 2,1-aminomutase